MSEATLQAIRDVLHEKFPGDRILDNYLDGKKVQSFRIERGEQLLHQLFVARELLDARRAAAVSTIFERFRIVEVLKQAGTTAVSVSSRGASIDGTPAPAPPAAVGEQVGAPPPVAAPASIEIPPIVPLAPAPTAAPPPTAAPRFTAAPAAAAAAPPAAAVAPPAATSDPFAVAVGLIRELRQSIQGFDNDLRQSAQIIDADLAAAEASVVEAQGRFQRATAQLSQLVTSMDTAVAKARAGLDRVLKRGR